jgi:hypothetical protein
LRSHTGKHVRLSSFQGKKRVVVAFHPLAFTPVCATQMQTYEKAWNVASGAVLSGFPRLQDGFPFYVAPLVAGLDSTQQGAVVDANDSGWIHAYEPAGGEAPGFPKFTGQWPSFSGVVGDPRFDGKLRLAYGTREGLLFVWKVHGSSSATIRGGTTTTSTTAVCSAATRRPAALAGIHVTRDAAAQPSTGARRATTASRAARCTDTGSTSPSGVTIPNLDQAHRLKRQRPRSPVAHSPADDSRRGGMFVAIRAIDDAGTSALAEVYVPTSSVRRLNARPQGFLNKRPRVLLAVTGNLSGVRLFPQPTWELLERVGVRGVRRRLRPFAAAQSHGRRP